MGSLIYYITKTDAFVPIFLINKCDHQELRRKFRNYEIWSRFCSYIENYVRQKWNKTVVCWMTLIIYLLLGVHGQVRPPLAASWIMLQPFLFLFWNDLKHFRNSSGIFWCQKCGCMSGAGAWWCIQCTTGSALSVARLAGATCPAGPPHQHNTTAA